MFFPYPIQLFPSLLVHSGLSIIKWRKISEASSCRSLLNCKHFIMPKLFFLTTNSGYCMLLTLPQPFTSMLKPRHFHMFFYCQTLSGGGQVKESIFWLTKTNLFHSTTNFSMPGTVKFGDKHDSTSTAEF